MITSFTFVKKREGWSDEDFFKRWAEHTRDFDLVDHPYITKNRLMMIASYKGYRDEGDVGSKTTYAQASLE
jgi:hypothetical protein